MKRAKDLVNKEIITVEESATFEEVIKIMKEKNVGEVPVMKKGEIIGVVTRDDILVKSGEAPLPPVIAFWDILITLPHNKEFVDKLSKLAGYRADEIMTKDFLIFDYEENLETVVTKIIENKVNFAIINENSKFLGIITKADLINKAF
jgi:CBS domain-containing protein